MLDSSFLRLVLFKEMEGVGLVIVAVLGGLIDYLISN
jgi:hypothetical protein